MDPTMGMRSDKPSDSVWNRSSSFDNGRLVGSLTVFVSCQRELVITLYSTLRRPRSLSC